jgi:hypothetical protein
LWVAAKGLEGTSMNVTRRCAIALFTFAGLPTTASGAYATTASYVYSGLVGTPLPGGVHKQYQDSFAKTDPAANVVVLQGADEESHETVSSGGTFKAVADLGSLAVMANAVALSKQRGGFGEFGASAKGSWIDRGTVDVPSLPLGWSVRIEAELHLHGSFGFDVTASDGANASASATLKLTGTGVPPAPYFGTYYGYANKTGSTELTLAPPTTVRLFSAVANGSPFDIGYTLELGSGASADAKFATVDPVNVSSLMVADFSNTLNWGGIVRVTNNVTGEPIQDWTITSESGFDYSQPVPEPAGLAVVVGIAVLLLARRRRPNDLLLNGRASKSATIAATLTRVFV